MSITMFSDQKLTITQELETEMNIITTETRNIVDSVFEIGGGDLAQGIIRSFQAGLLDIPFVPSRFNLGKVLPACDNYGACAFWIAVIFHLVGKLRIFTGKN
jgi:methylaspartate mutase epsilon subunit